MEMWHITNKKGDNIMYRYLLFGYDQYYPLGGMFVENK